MSHLNLGAVGFFLYYYFGQNRFFLKSLNIALGATPFGVHCVMEERPGRVWRRFSKGFGCRAVVHDVTCLPAIYAGVDWAIAADVSDGAATPTTVGIPAVHVHIFV